MCGSSGALFSLEPWIPAGSVPIGLVVRASKFEPCNYAEMDLTHAIRTATRVTRGTCVSSKKGGCVKTSVRTRGWRPRVEEGLLGDTSPKDRHSQFCVCECVRTTLPTQALTNLQLIFSKVGKLLDLGLKDSQQYQPKLPTNLLENNKQNN